MKLVTFRIEKDGHLIIQFPIFVQPYTQQPLILYQLETVPVPIIDENPNAQSYTELKVKKPYIALNSQTYINIWHQELATCKRIGYEFYCKELLVVKHKTIHSCESTIYFDLDMEIIKQIVTSCFTIIKQTLHQQFWMVETKLFLQIGPQITYYLINECRLLILFDF